MGRFGIPALELQRGVGVHVGKPVHQGHDVRAVHARRARAAEDVTVAGGVDYHPAPDGLAAGLGLRDHPPHRAILD